MVVFHDDKATAGAMVHARCQRTCASVRSEKQLVAEGIGALETGATVARTRQGMAAVLVTLQKIWQHLCPAPVLFHNDSIRARAVLCMTRDSA